MLPFLSTRQLVYLSTRQLNKKMSKLSNIRKSFVHIFGGDFLTRDFFRQNIVFLIALAIVAVVSVTYNYNIRRQLEDIYRLRTELRIARYEALIESAELARIGRQEEVERRVREAGLDIRVTDEPVFYIQRRTRRR